MYKLCQALCALSVYVIWVFMRNHLTPEHRLEIMDHFCMYCGRVVDDPACKHG